MTGRVLIISRVPGFRRAGVAHVGEYVWPAGTFTAKQLDQLVAEPNLIVRVGPDEEAIMPASTSDALDEGRSVDGEAATTQSDTAPEAEEAASGTNSEAQSGDTVEGQTAEPEPVIATAGALTLGDEAKSLPVSVVSRAEPPSETGEVAEAGPETASATETTAEPEKPASVKKPSRKKAD